MESPKAAAGDLARCFQKGVSVRIANKTTPLSIRWLAPLAILSTMPVLRMGDVQAVEIAQVICLGTMAPIFVYRGLNIPLGGLWRRYGIKYVLFLGLCVLVSGLSLRLSFHPPPDISWLKRPGLLSLSRIFELLLAAYFMIAIAETLRRRPALFRMVADAYAFAATLGACGSIVAWVLFRVAGIPSFPIYGADSRVRGLFNEGGPYGIFLVSAVVVVLLRIHVVRPVYGFVHKTAVIILLAALLLSGSKVGLLAAMGLCALALLSGGRRRMLVLAVVLALIVTVFVTRFQGSLFGYLYAYLNFDEAYYYRPDDPSLIMGRIAAMLIVPRIISAHPLLGIGVGNYSLMRNDPDYLQGLPPVDEWDLAGMGLLGSAAEFGIPLTLFLFVLLVQPLLHTQRRKAPLILTLAAGFQPIAFLLGVNLNFFYPWLVAALVLSLEPTGEAAERSERRLDQ
ncbi:MAG TPA: O-antigen ligase family protein [Bryobacteraceae bacterium]|nr:O-antigen ligase family protein [Bryobacteraceae bacterium]